MLHSHRKTGLERRGFAKPAAWLETHALFSQLFRVHAVTNVGVVSEDRLSTLAYERLGKVGRPVITVVLEGHARIEALGRVAWLGRGDASVVEAKGAILMRQSRAGERYRALVVEWEAPLVGPRPAGFTSAAAESTLVEDAEAVFAHLAAPSLGLSHDADTDRSRVLGAIARIGDALAVPLTLRADAVSPQLVELSHALDDLLSDMRERPMMIDLHMRLGVSERTVNRMVQDFNARFGFNASTWQDARSRRRVLIGAALLTAEGATASEIAEAMGYASLPSLSRALKLAGMPSPRDIPALVRDLLEDRPRRAS